MKSLKILLTFIVVSAVYSACQTNPYIEARKKFQVNPLIMLSEPRMNTGKCGLEWQKHGTCCDHYNLPSHISSNEDKLIQASNVIVANFQKLAGFSNSVFQIVKQLALSVKTTDQTRNTIINNANLFLNNGSNLMAFESFASIGSTSQTDLYKTEMTKCWTDMRALRISSICSTCSGRAQIYFNGEKGLLEEKYCLRSLQNCLTSLKMTFKLIKMVKWLMDTFMPLKNMSLYTRVDGFISFKNMTKYYDDLMKDGLAFSVLNITSSNLSDKNLTLPICHRFLNLANLPFIIGVSKSFFSETPYVVIEDNASRAISASTTKIQADMPALDAKLATLLANWKAQNPGEISRYLQSLDSLQTDWFWSDVEFTKDLITGSLDSTSLSTTTKIPMNMSLSFP